MNALIIIHCIFIIGFAYYGLLPFDKKRIRACWAKVVFVISAFIGIAKGVIGLGSDLGWVTVGAKANWFLLYGASGLLLGLILSLILSGQLRGSKRESLELGHERTG
jgi:hypothetical protein